MNGTAPLGALASGRRVEGNVASLPRAGRRPALPGGHLKRRGLMKRTLTLTMILMAMIFAMSVGLRSGKAQSNGQQPDYSNVDDFVNGATHLLRSDDLVMTFAYFRNDNASLTRDVLFSAGTQNTHGYFESFDQVKIVPDTWGADWTCNDPDGCYADYPFHGSAPVTGRFFHSDRDQTLLWPFDTNKSYTSLVVVEGQTAGAGPQAGLKQWSSVSNIDFVRNAQRKWVCDYCVSAVADFDADGYDELFMGYGWANGETGKMSFAVPYNRNDSSQGFWFTNNSAAEIAGYQPRQATAGDFNGDGRPEVAVLLTGPQNQLILATISVDPTNLNNLTVSTPVPIATLSDAGYHPLQLTAGHFTGVAHDQLVVGYQTQDNTNVIVQFYDFATNSIQPVLKTTWTTPDVAASMTLRLKAGQFDWSNPYEQIAWMSSSAFGTRLSILTVDPQTLTVSRKADTTISDVIGQDGVTYLAWDIAIGNFDNLLQGGARNPDLQIAVIGGRLGDDDSFIGTAALYIYGVSPDSRR